MPPEQAEAAAETPAVVETAETASTEAAVAEEAASGGEDSGEGGEAAAEPAEGAGEAAQPEPKKKSPVAQLQGRVGHLTRQLAEKDTALEEANRRAEAAEALLNGGASSEANPTPSPAASAPAPGTPEFDQLVDQRAAQKAQQQAFVRDCNTIFDAGVAKHGEEAFKEAVTNLNVLGLMDAQIVEAAMATDAPADVIHFLGSDVDEAARIRALSPARMGAEIAKLAAKLSAPAEQPQISRAPAPITPVGGAAVASNDVSDPNISQEEYVRRRKAQGSRWAR